MPLADQISVLARGFDILFDQENGPSTQAEAAKAWAQAYVNYALAAGIPDSAARKDSFAAALTAAFNPELAGGGRILFTQAFQVFWLGLSVPYMGGVVSLVTPVGSLDSPQPEDATPKQQADGLAQTIAAFTLGSVKVLVGGTPPPIPIT